MKNANRVVYIILLAFLAATAVFALLSRGGAELRRALEENREFQIRSDGETIVTVSLRDLLDLEPQEFHSSFATSINKPRQITLRGVELRLLFEAFEVDITQANYFTVIGLDSYHSPLTYEEVHDPESVYICFEMDGELLKTQSEGGYGHFMMVIRNTPFAQRWCKYVEAIDIRPPA